MLPFSFPRFPPFSLSHFPVFSPSPSRFPLYLSHNAHVGHYTSCLTVCPVFLRENHICQSLCKAHFVTAKFRFTFLHPRIDIYIIGDAGLKTQDAQDSLSSAIQCLESCVLYLSKSDYSHYLVWIAEAFNTNVLQHFHQKIMTTYITYTIANDYYMPTYRRNRKTCKLRTEAEN